jgi:Protein of unknown function (DUF2752).
MNFFLSFSWNGIIEWLKNHAITCPSKHVFRIDCPGCGLQRSVFALLEGNLMESLRLYPATIPILCLLLYTGLHLKFNFSGGSAIVKWGYIMCIIIIIAFYIYKIFTHKII